METEIAKGASGSSRVAKHMSTFSDHAFFLLIIACLVGILAGMLVLSMGMGATKIGVRDVVALRSRPSIPGPFSKSNG
jgi:hypothetical protein